MAKPKLALIPATIGTKVYSVLPSDGDGDFAFSRSTVATRVNSLGLIEEVPVGHNRLNYDLLDGKVYGCPNLLLEPARTNLISYSEDFSNSSWGKTNSSITSNSVISPDGALNADKLVENTTTGEKFTQTIISVSNTTIYTASVFVKFAGREWIRFTDAQSSNRIHFNTKTGVFGAVTGTVISYESTVLDNGWYKLSLTTTSVATAYAIRIVLAENDNDVSYQGDGTSGVYIWGASLEAGSYPTSYIKTTGSSVTRNAETATGSGNAQTFNDAEGVLMVEVSALAKDGTNRYISISDGSDANRLYLRYRASNNVFSGGVVVNNSLQVLFDTTDENILNFSKFLLKYKENDFEFWLNGFKLLVDTSGSTFPNGTLNQLRFDTGGTGVPFYGNTKQLQYFDSALADTQLEQLTSWVSFQEMANGQLYTIE